MQEKWDEFKVKLREFWDTIKESESYLQLKAKWDELDDKSKIYTQLGIVAGVFILVISSVLIGISSVNRLKNEIEDQENLIAYLQSASDTIKQLKSQSLMNQDSMDANMPLNQFASTILETTGIDVSKSEISAERFGQEDKVSKEVLVDIKLNQVNLRQIVNYLFNMSDKGKNRSVVVKDLNVDTKADPTGWMDAAITISSFRAK